MGKYSKAKQELDEIIQVAEQEDRYALEEPIEAFNKNIISYVNENKKINKLHK